MGCYNSGTTLLRNLIAAHPEVDALPAEGASFVDGLMRPEDFGWTRMWVNCLDRIRFTETADDEKIKRTWALWLKRSKRYYLEKSISNSARMRWLDAHFEDAYFISIVRNGYAVAEGIRRRAREGKIPRDYPIELCAEQWVLSNEIIDEDGPMVSRFLSLTYEDLVRDPAEKLRKVFAFLDLSVKIEQSPSADIRVEGRSFRIDNMNSSSISRLSQADIQGISRTANKMLYAKGYPVL